MFFNMKYVTHFVFRVLLSRLPAQRGLFDASQMDEYAYEGRDG